MTRLTTLRNVFAAIGLIAAVCVTQGQVRLRVQPSGGLPQFSLPDLHYQGSFRIPTGYQGASGRYYNDQMGGSIGYDPNDGNLFITANGNFPLTVGKVTIPALGSQTMSTAWSSLPTASSVHVPIDLTEGTENTSGGPQSGGNGAGGGGLYVNGSRLYTVEYAIYDGSCGQNKEIWSHDVDLGTAGHLGPYHLNTRSGYVHGPLTSVPPAWQASLGGDMINSFAGASVPSCQTYGPGSGVAWSISDFAAITPATALIYYIDTPTQRFLNLYRNDTSPPSPWPWTGGQASYWNSTFVARAGGNLIPVGYASYLVMGSIGRGYYIYGIQDATNLHANPPVWEENSWAGADASTSHDGLTVTVPNKTVAPDSLIVGKRVCLTQGTPQAPPQDWSSLTTPVLNAASNNAVAVGCSAIVGQGNSGTATAFFTVSSAFPFPGDLTGLTYVAGEPKMYDPTNTSGQGNHGYPYMTVAYIYNMNDLVAVKNNMKSPWDLVPVMLNLSTIFPDSANGGGGVMGLTTDPATKRVFFEMHGNGGPYPIILVFTYD